VIRQGEHPRDAASDDIEVLSRCHSKIYQIVKELPATSLVPERNPEPNTAEAGLSYGMRGRPSRQPSAFGSPRLSGDWVVIGWLSGGYRVVIGWLSGGYRVVIGW
jgi:hypothetical protein